MLRTVGVIVCSLLLCFSLLGANAVLAIDRGPMDPDQTTTALEESGAYEAIHDEATEMLLAELEDAEVEGLPVDIESLARDALGPDWIAYEVERHADEGYAYLRGDADELVIRIDEARLQEELRAGLEAQRDEISYADLGYEELDRILESESAYESERLSMRSTLLAQFDMDRSAGFGQEELANLSATPESYEAERTAIRERIAAELMDELDAEAGFGHDRLAAMRTSEEEFEAAQTTFRDEQKDRIQAETDRELSEEELEAAYAEREDEIVAATAEAIDDELGFEELPDGIDPPTDGLTQLTAEALATEYSFETFNRQYDAELAAFEDDLVDEIATSGDAFADEARELVAFEYPDDAPPTLESAAEPLEALVVEAITTDLDYERFAAEYDAHADDVEAAVAAHAWDNREEYEEELDALRAAELGDMPDPIAEELAALQELALEAVMTDLSYEEFRTGVDETERAMIDAVVTQYFEEESPASQEFDVSSEVESNAGDELDLVRSVIAAIGLAVLGLFALSALFAGGIVLASGTRASASIAVGLVSGVVGIASYLGASMVPGWAGDLLQEAVPDDAFQGVAVDLLSHLLAPWATQSLILAGLGLALVAAGIVWKFDLVGAVGPSDHEDEE